MSIKIGILSDSHTRLDYLKLVLKQMQEEGINYLLHAGDLCKQEALELVKSQNLPYTCVFGNNDYGLIEFANIYNIKKEPSYFKIQNSTFKMMHLPFYMTPDSDVVVYGHTHIFEHNFNGKTLFINPGEVCAREKPRIEFVILQIDEESYKLEYNYFKKEDLSLHKEEYIYEK